MLSFWFWCFGHHQQNTRTDCSPGEQKMLTRNVEKRAMIFFCDNKTPFFSFKFLFLSHILRSSLPGIVSDTSSSS